MESKTYRYDRGVPLNKAMINIRNLRLRTFIGFNPEEGEKKQDVVVNEKAS